MKSLRARLLGGLVALAAVGLVAAGATTYTQLRSFLVARLDQQLELARIPVQRSIEPQRGPGGRGRGGPDRGPARPGPGAGTVAPRPQSALPAGAYGELRDHEGAVIEQVAVALHGTTHAPPALAAGTLESLPRFSTFAAVGEDEWRYRVLVERVREGTLIVALPDRDVTQTLRRLLAVELAVGAGVLLALTALGLWVVRLGLRPLDAIEGTAAAIAGGDLSRRVEHADAGTEVGRLGLALNAMLGQIEESFAERAASEDRLRRFLADASHELRTPLTSIRGYAELFRRGAADRPEDLAKAMRRIEDEAKRMGVLVDDLLLLARLDQGRPLEHSPVDLVEVAEDATADARAVDPSRTITFDSPDRLTISGDEARLRQVANNLLSNALAHTPAGSSVEVRVSVDGGTAHLEVADRGPGLDDGEAARVFERFYRPDSSRTRAHGGAGLGLAIVAAIAEAHGGSAEVNDREGGGLVFRVTVPVGAA